MDLVDLVKLWNQTLLQYTRVGGMDSIHTAALPRNAKLKDDPPQLSFRTTLCLPHSLHPLNLDDLFLELGRPLRKNQEILSTCWNDTWYTIECALACAGRNDLGCSLKLYVNKPFLPDFKKSRYHLDMQSILSSIRRPSRLTV